jgi:hypothetical protein
MQSTLPKVYLCPAQAHQFASAEPIARSRSSIPDAIASASAGSIDELLYLGLSEILAWPILHVGPPS